MDVAALSAGLIERGVTVVIGQRLDHHATIKVKYPPEAFTLPAGFEPSTDWTSHRGVWVRANGQVWVLAPGGTIGYDRDDDGEVPDQTLASLDALGELLAPAPEAAPVETPPPPAKPAKKSPAKKPTQRKGT